MKITKAQSLKSTPRDAVLELKEKLNNSNIKAITFFASSTYNSQELIDAMNEIFPNIIVWGCTSYAEIITGSITSKSIVAMAFTDEIIEDIKVEVIDSTKINVEDTINSFEKHYSSPISSLDNKKHFILTYFNWGSRNEEEILDKLGDYINIFTIGGSAADDLEFHKAKTFANGKCYDNSAVITLIKSKVNVGFEKMQSFVPTEHKVVATKVDEEAKIVYEINGQPIIETFSNLINVPIDKLQDVFHEYSFGLVIDDQVFLRAMKYAPDNIKGFEVGCVIKEGMELTIMKQANLITDTQNDLTKLKNKYKSISGILAFDCCYRYINLLQTGTVSDYVNLFTDFPIMGFCSFGETYIGHLNQSLVMLVFE